MTDIQNLDNDEYFKWCLVRYLNSEEHHRARVRKFNYDFAKELDVIDTKLRISTKFKKNICIIRLSAFGYEDNEKTRSKCRNFFKNHVGLLLIRSEGKRQHLLIKYLIHLCMIIQFTCFRERKYFCHYCLQAFSAAEI